MNVESERIEDVTSHRGEVVKSEKMLPNVQSWKEGCFRAETLIAYLIGHVSWGIEDISPKNEEQAKIIDSWVEKLNNIKREYKALTFETSKIKASEENGVHLVTFGNNLRANREHYGETLPIIEERDYQNHYHKLMVIYSALRALFNEVYPIDIDEPISFVGIDDSERMIKNAEEYDASRY